jgi:hypothetical protein
LQLKPRRLPEKEAFVTIAAGFVCPEGVVIAADTKRSHGDSEQTSVNKIELVEEFLPGRSRLRPHTRAAYAAIAGSALDANLISNIVPYIKKLFRDNANADVAVFRRSLVELMPALYASDAITSYPHSYSTDLDTEFLVAARPNYRERAALFLINSSLVTEVESGARIIGCGTMQETAQELSALNLGLHDSALAALYLIYEAKRRYSIVGGATHIFSIPHPAPLSTEFRPRPERVWDQGQKESLFAELRGWHHRVIMTVGSPTISKKSYSAVMKDYRKALDRVRNEFDTIEKREQAHQRKVTREEAKQFVKVLEARLPTKDESEK